MFVIILCFIALTEMKTVIVLLLPVWSVKEKRISGNELFFT